MEKIKLIKKWKNELTELEKDYENNVYRNDYDIFSEIDDLILKMKNEGATGDDFTLIGDCSLDKKISKYIDEEFSLSTIKDNNFGDINDSMIYADNSKYHKNGVVFIKIEKMNVNYIDEILRLIPSFRYTKKNYRTEQLGNIFWEEHNNDKNSKDRVDIFKDYRDMFYVSYWKNGEFMYSNDEKESCLWSLK
ncbi:hypothetical protein DVV91_10225 [Clostridium botulinum]|uniref:hypothetical protein n=1 Tax=Clostridium botulinum TaxID=1491 RepID=UPI0019683BD0|nr:hypothetical protein [Clostridium botulinum]MBN1074718.1 hypothetical protein [Clostridium botulinum]